jgi:hypothetical protein
MSGRLAWVVFFKIDTKGYAYFKEGGTQRKRESFPSVLLTDRVLQEQSQLQDGMLVHHTEYQQCKAWPSILDLY